MAEYMKRYLITDTDFSAFFKDSWTNLLYHSRPKNNQDLKNRWNFEKI